MSALVARNLAALIALFLGCTGCARESSAFTLDIESLRQLGSENTAGITYDESHEPVLVTVIDKHGDGHIHQLLLGDVTRAQAIELLKQKQHELEQHQ